MEGIFKVSETSLGQQEPQMMVSTQLVVALSGPSTEPSLRRSFSLIHTDLESQENELLTLESFPLGQPPPRPLRGQLGLQTVPGALKSSSHSVLAL